MQILNRFRCLMGKHRRDRATVRVDIAQTRALCVGCRAPMIKTGTGWELVEPPRASVSTDAP